MDERISDIFTSLRLQITNDEALLTLDEIEQLFTEEHCEIENLQMKWTNFFNGMISSIRVRAFMPSAVKLRAIMETIDNVFKKISPKNVAPQESSVAYCADVKKFRDEFTLIKQKLTRKQFDDEFVEKCLAFQKSFTEKYKTSFSGAKIDPDTRTQMLGTLDTAITDLVDKIQEIIHTNLIPAALNQLNEIIMKREDFQFAKDPSEEKTNDTLEEYDDDSLFNKLKVSDEPDSYVRSEEEEKSKGKVKRGEFYSTLWEIANEIRTLAESASGEMSEFLHQNAMKLDRLAQRDIESEWFEQKRRLESEVHRSREMLHLLNEAQSMRSNLSLDKLRSLNQDQLITVIQGLSSGKDVRVPIELTVLHGAPNEFKELTKRYKDAADYCEKAENDINRLNASVIALKNENQRLRCQAAAMSRSAAFHNELDAINERTFEIQTQLLQNPDDTHDLTQEIEHLKTRRAELEHELIQLDDHNLHAQIELLKSETRELRAQISKHLEEKADLEKQIKDISAEVVKKPTVLTEILDIDKPNPIAHHASTPVLMPDAAAPVIPVLEITTPEQEKPKPKSVERRKSTLNTSRFANLKSAYAQKTIRKTLSKHPVTSRAVTPPPINKPPLRFN